MSKSMSDAVHTYLTGFNKKNEPVVQMPAAGQQKKIENAHLAIEKDRNKNKSKYLLFFSFFCSLFIFSSFLMANFHLFCVLLDYIELTKR
jgi:hypothetical protein